MRSTVASLNSSSGEPMATDSETPTPVKDANRVSSVTVSNIDTQASTTIEADVVIMGVGVAPATELAVTCAWMHHQTGRHDQLVQCCASVLCAGISNSKTSMHTLARAFMHLVHVRITWHGNVAALVHCVAVN